MAWHWRTPAFFHPEPVSLGYTDAFFLHGAIYSLWRLLGFGWLAADEGPA